jgi:Bacterial PH domain
MSSPQQGHRHTPPGEHEYDFEPQFGLPEALPADEKLLWQGSPDVRAMMLRVFHVRKMAVYFGVILALRATMVLYGGGSIGDAAIACVWLMPLVLFAIGMLWLVAYLSARNTVYSLTDKRVVMRIGIVLTLTFNLPYRSIAAAGVKVGTDDIGNIILTLNGKDKIAYVHLWPHARPWRLAQPEPMLCCVNNAPHVAALLTQAWSAATGVAVSKPSFNSTHTAGAVVPSRSSAEQQALQLAS